MKVLIIDDRPEAVRGIKDHCDDNGWECKPISFDRFDSEFSEFNPDAIVLDWKDDASGNLEGNALLEKIWESGFKPVIIFSGYAELISLDKKYTSSNLVKIQSKGDEEPVINYLDTIEKFVPVISTLKQDFNDALIVALNSIMPMSKTDGITDGVVRFVLAKRVSNYFDENCSENAPPWIQYVCPPIAKSLCVCDVIKKVSPTEDDLLKIGEPDEYRLILTPSCDMAQNKVTHALCAKCYDKNVFHSYPPRDNPSNNQINNITSHLNAGYRNTYVSLPAFPESLPYLTVNLKQLEFIPLDKIALSIESIRPEQHDYFRVASVDSPFREQIVWAYMINSCRPGMPDRNMDLWAKELMKP